VSAVITNYYLNCIKVKNDIMCFDCGVKMKPFETNWLIIATREINKEDYDDFAENHTKYCKCFCFDCIKEMALGEITNHI
jgi:hypothetical protein